MPRSDDEGRGRGRGATAAIEELAGCTDEDVTVDTRDVTDGLGAKVRPRWWLLLLSGTAPLGNVDVIGDGFVGVGEGAFDFICVNEAAAVVVVSTVDSAVRIPSQVFVLPVNPSPPPPALVSSITLTSF